MPTQNTYVPLSESTRAIVLGTLLGDGSLKKQEGYKNARLQFRHSISQQEYFLWKVQALSEVQTVGSVHEQKADGFSQHKKLHFQSSALPALTELHELTHRQNKLYIRRKWLNTLSPLSLAVWWCDDGSIIGGGRKGVLCTDGFLKKSVTTLAQYLEVAWGVSTTVAPVRRKRAGTQEEYWRIWFRSQESFKIFLRIILPHIPTKSMLKKVFLRYKDPQFQQRWISEVVALSQFSEAVVLAEFAKEQTRISDKDIVRSS